MTIKFNRTVDGLQNIGSLKKFVYKPDVGGT